MAMQLLGRGDEVVDVRVPSRPLTAKEIRDLNMTCNIPFGAFDFDILSADFEPGELVEMGLDLMGFTENDVEKLYDGMPEYDNKTIAFRDIIMHFKDQKSVNAFAKLLKQEITEKTKMLWYPEEKPQSGKDKAYERES